MTRSTLLKAATLAGVALLVGINAAAGQAVSAQLTGFEEVPAIMSLGKGTFTATVNTNSISYRITYDKLEGNVIQAHIHFAQPGVNGGIMVFLCTNLGNGPAGTPLCPGTKKGSVIGTLSKTNVVGPAVQNIGVGAFGKVSLAIRRGISYANVHTDLFPGGEIRGQVRLDD
jgi:hypothetical protein